MPFSPDLTEIGVTEVVAALAHPFRQVFLESYDDMRLRVMDNIVTLAVRRYLVKEGIPHQAAPALSFSEADRYDIAISGRRCVPLSQLDCGQRDGRVYLPEETGGRFYRDVDIYLFVRLTGRVTRSREEIDRAQLAGEPVYRNCGLKASVFDQQGQTHICCRPRCFMGIPFPAQAIGTND